MDTKRERLIKEQIEAAWPEFDECLKEALEPYHEEYMEVTA